MLANKDDYYIKKLKMDREASQAFRTTKRENDGLLSMKKTVVQQFGPIENKVRTFQTSIQFRSVNKEELDTKDLRPLALDLIPYP